MFRRGRSKARLIPLERETFAYRFAPHPNPLPASGARGRASLELRGAENAAAYVLLPVKTGTLSALTKNSSSSFKHLAAFPSPSVPASRNRPHNPLVIGWETGFANRPHHPARKVRFPVTVEEALEGGSEIPGKRRKRPGRAESLNTQYPKYPACPIPAKRNRRIFHPSGQKCCLEGGRGIDRPTILRQPRTPRWRR
ncbi:hypothetical protein J2857_001309 [Neorhizobium galegae]|nr:hypothetical protein [Neorhizobium galegae]